MVDNRHPPGETRRPKHWRERTVRVKMRHSVILCLTPAPWRRAGIKRRRARTCRFTASQRGSPSGWNYGCPRWTSTPTLLRTSWGNTSSARSISSRGTTRLPDSRGPTRRTGFWRRRLSRPLTWRRAGCSQVQHRWEFILCKLTGIYSVFLFVFVRNRKCLQVILPKYTTVGWEGSITLIIMIKYCQLAARNYFNNIFKQAPNRSEQLLHQLH